MPEQHRFTFNQAIDAIHAPIIEPKKHAPIEGVEEMEGFSNGLYEVKKLFDDFSQAIATSFPKIP